MGSDQKPDHGPIPGQDHDPRHLGVVRFTELAVVPWRNGGGVTREILASGGSGSDGFDWRISIADVSEPGPFSAFPGFDRVITLDDSLSAEQRSSLLAIADKCPVHRTLTSEVSISTVLAATSATVAAGTA